MDLDKNSKTLYVACDFDGTLTAGGDRFPECGNENPYAIHVLKRLQRDGHKVILNTCRRGEPLKKAVAWLQARGIRPDAVNDNPWSRAIYNDPTPSHKVFADLYIDDRSLGVKKTADGSVDFKYINRNYRRIFGAL